MIHTSTEYSQMPMPTLVLRAEGRAARGAAGVDHVVEPVPGPRFTANLRTKILDFIGFDFKQNLNPKGWDYHVHREMP